MLEDIKGLGSPKFHRPQNLLSLEIRVGILNSNPDCNREWVVSRKCDPNIDTLFYPGINPAGQFKITESDIIREPRYRKLLSAKILNKCHGI